MQEKEDKDLKKKENEGLQPTEAEKMEREIERSLKVANMKVTHGLIEAVEKHRKRSSIISLCLRILAHSDEIRKLASYLLQVPQDIKFDNLPSGIKSYSKSVVETYKSIRFDFKSVTEITEDKMNKLFPEIDIKFESLEEFQGILAQIVNQEEQMALYLLRMF